MESFAGGADLPGFAASTLPGPPPGVVASPLAAADFDALLTVGSEPDAVDDDDGDEDDDDDDDDDDEYRSKLREQHRDLESNWCETGRKFAAW